MANKEPWLAVNLSVLFPGIGQMYAGKVIRGIIIITFYLGGAICGGALLLTGGSLWLSLSVLIAATLVAIISLVDAYRSTRRSNSEQFERERKSEKDPWLAIFLTSLHLGLGHFYLRRPVQGILLFLLGLTTVIFPVLLFPVLLVTPIIFLWMYRTVPRQTDSLSQASTIIMMIILGCIGPFLTLGGSFAIRRYVLETRFIPAGSMEPALQVNDRILVNKVRYRGLASPQRGDIVVFNPPDAIAERFSQAFVKRIIGLPGESVEIQNGRVVSNGEGLEESYVAAGNLTQTEPCRFSGFEQPFLRQPQTIPAKQYLVLGDNRENSLDGRCWGLIPHSHIIGKVTHRFWPLNRSGRISDIEGNTK